MIELDTIYNEDCLEGMKRIDDLSIDCIICDPPYGVLNKQSEGCRWDKIIPFEPMWEQFSRVKKPNAPVCIFGQGMFTAKLMLSNQNAWRYNLVWNKIRPVGFLNARRMPLRTHEDICVFYDKMPTYNPQMTKGKLNHSRGKNPVRACGCYGKTSNTDGMFSEDKFPRSIINIPTVKTGNFHPTQKPIELMRYLIRTYSNQGDTVLDCCFGGGSTIIAAIQERRHYIGFELDKVYFDKAQERIEKEKQQLTFDF